MTENNNISNSSDSVAACCAQFYEQDIVQELLGGSYHPGGENLSQTLVKSLKLNPGQSILDVACGVGTTTRMMATDFGSLATGLDFSQINVNKATQLSSADATKNTGGNGELPIADQQACCAPGDPCCEPEQSVSTVPFGALNFVHGSADSLPFEDTSFDGLICECAVSTFADQPKVASEFFRVIKPGGVFGMTDMVVNGELPAEFAEKVAPWTCMAKALTSAGYDQLFSQAGFELIDNQDHSHTLLEMATDIKRKLVMAGVGKALGAIESLGMSLSEMRAMLSQATDLVRAETVQYRLLTFRR